jgi:uncharacterized protein (TIGR02145 family)
MKIQFYLLITFSLLVFKIQAQIISDIDGNAYNTITIGSQVWMQENLRTTHLNNGQEIPTTTLTVNNDSTSIYHWAYDDDSVNINTYGRLYTWFTVNTNTLCPLGWHVPDYDEWIILGNFLGGDSIAGAKMKEVGTEHWSSTDVSVNNISNFTGLPGGFRGNPYGFINLNTLGSFWSATLWSSDAFPRGYIFNLKSTNSILEESIAVGNCGLSVRCMKDITTDINNFHPKEIINIFPNPTTDKLNINFEKPGEKLVSIYDITGILIFETQLTNLNNSLNISSLSHGIYIIKIAGDGINVTKKMIKE